MNCPDWLIKNVDKVIGETARASKSFKQLPQEIRCSKEALDIFKSRMKHFHCEQKDLKPLNLFSVPLIFQPGIPKYQFAVVKLDMTKLLRRRDQQF